jgi:hypothetical protein
MEARRVFSLQAVTASPGFQGISGYYKEGKLIGSGGSTDEEWKNTASLLLESHTLPWYGLRSNLPRFIHTANICALVKNRVFDTPPASQLVTHAWTLRSHTIGSETFVDGSTAEGVRANARDHCHASHAVAGASKENQV